MKYITKWLCDECGFIADSEKEADAHFMHLMKEIEVEVDDRADGESK